MFIISIAATSWARDWSGTKRHEIQKGRSWLLKWRNLPSRETRFDLVRFKHNLFSERAGSDLTALSIPIWSGRLKTIDPT